ncbi:MAG: hypothetical protein JWM59_3756 [Verrucomicrobiales bacterium]|nr:hypothetical protein [Verrucomicrobiales bacterium]
MDSPQNSVLDPVVKIDPADGEKCRIEVEPKAAQSLIRFLLDRKIQLLPPEGGVARTFDLQVEPKGMPPLHPFFAYDTQETLQAAVTDWKKSGPRQAQSVV